MKLSEEIASRISEHHDAEGRRTLRRWADTVAEMERRTERARDLPGAISEAAERMVRRVMRHRERYIRAWCAATGLHPARCKLVERTIPGDVMTIEVQVVPAEEVTQ